MLPVDVDGRWLGDGTCNIRSACDVSWRVMGDLGCRGGHRRGDIRHIFKVGSVGYIGQQKIGVNENVPVDMRYSADAEPRLDVSRRHSRRKCFPTIHAMS